jgi:hypothetical protein
MQFFDDSLINDIMFWERLQTKETPDQKTPMK